MPRGGNRGGGRSGNNFRGGRQDKGIKQMLRAQENKLRDGVYTENQDMYGTARSASQVDVYLDGTVNLLDDLRALTTLKVDNASIVKAVTNSSAMRDITLIDLKLNVQGPAEDEVYAMYPLLIKNIRRGNTVLRIETPTGQDFVLGRKGLEKFFDLRYEFISPEQRFQNDSSMQVEHHMQKNYILAGPLRAILEGHKVEVLKTLKANGENVQVSWNNRVEAWVICSKNVALIAQTREDANSRAYTAPRFAFATEMANVWFDKLVQINKERGAEAIEELKRDLDGKTLVGEYIGSQEHQHLVKYSRVTIIFYAVVVNNSMIDCVPCDEAWALFDKWGLDKVAIQTLGSFDNYERMCDSLCRVFKDVAKSEIAQEEEGNVLYFIKRPQNGAEAGGDVLSLCKLKTLEYRLFRKMREKLRNFYGMPIADQTDEKERTKIKSFISEAKELSQEHELPRPLNYYIELFKTAFEFLDLAQENIDLLNEEYVTFSEKLLQFFTKKHKNATFAKNSNFFFSPILDIQGDIQYGKGSIQSYQLKSALEEEKRPAVQDDDYPDSEEESKQPAAQQSNQRTVTYQKKTNSEQQQFSDEPIKRQASQATQDRTVFIIIPFGVPGSGKSTILKALKAKIETLDRAEWSFATVSSDAIRAEKMAPLIKEGKTRSQAFQATAKSGPAAYGHAFERLCDQSQRPDTGKNHVIFLDKNHPVSGIKRVVDDVRKMYARTKINVKKLYLVPENNSSERPSRVQGYPFPENFIFQVYAWGQERTEHETLDNSDPSNMIEVQTMFLKMSKGLVYDNAFLKKYQLDGYLRVPMSVDSFTLPDSLINTFKKMVGEFQGIGNESNKANNEEFIAGLRENLEVLMQFPDTATSLNKIMDQLTRVKDMPVSRITDEDPERQSATPMEEEKKSAQPSMAQSHRQVRQVIDTTTSGAAAAQQQQVQPIIKNNRAPVFLGIDCECDASFQRKLTQLFVTGFKQAGEPQQMINDFKKMCQQMQAYSPYKFPNSHHVTTLFIGGNKNKMKQPQYQYHQEGKGVDVEIRALIYVPDKLVAGICFPNCEIENEFPHLTLMVSQGWAPVMSNTIIQATCKRNGVFEQAYFAAEDGKKPAQGAGVHTAQNVIIDKKGQQEVVFVLLREPITFNGRLKSFFG